MSYRHRRRLAGPPGLRQHCRSPTCSAVNPTTARRSRRGRTLPRMQLSHAPMGHHPAEDRRHVPVHPALVETLRQHIDRFSTGVEGRLLVTRTGKARGPLGRASPQPAVHRHRARVWHKARTAAFSPELVAAPLARRPYELRHACLSTRLNAGVPPAQVAEWAGHGVNDLLRVYAKCMDEQDELAKQRTEAALRRNDCPIGRLPVSRQDRMTRHALHRVANRTARRPTRRTRPWMRTPGRSSTPWTAWGSRPNPDGCAVG